MFSKKIFYLIIILLLIIIGTAVILSRSNKNAKQNAQEQNTSSSNANVSTDNSQSSNKDTLTIKTPSGNVVTKDFEKNAEVSSSGVIYFVDREGYNIGYNSTSNEFIVTLLVGKNVESVRKDAENDLLTSLGISQQDACKLSVFLYVSAAVNESLSQNHGLSFCPDSLAFPN